MNLYLLFAALLFSAAAGAQGYRMGAAANEATHTAAALRQAEADAAADRKLAAAEQQARLLAQALEDAAYADPVQNPVCLPRSRVLRLRER